MQLEDLGKFKKKNESITLSVSEPVTFRLIAYGHN
jgi:hypothetical protein